MIHRWNESSLIKYTSPTPKLLALGVGALLIAFAISVIENSFNSVLISLNTGTVIRFTPLFYLFLIAGIVLFIIAYVEKKNRTDEKNIYYLVRHRLCSPKMGNPLHLKPGEIEPNIAVVRLSEGFRIRVVCPSVKFEKLTELPSVISDSLRKEYGDYAVIKKEEDIAGRYVDYYIINVVKKYQQQSVYRSINDVPVYEKTKIHIREDSIIDYSKVLNSSTIIVGGTRSGKTTGIISTFLLPILKAGRDQFGSKVVIIDPKSAELSQCYNVLSPSVGGYVDHILKAVDAFNKTRIARQKIINETGRKNGKAAKWYGIGMKPCILFLDEWIAVQDLFPKKASKDKPDYCVATFQGLIRQIATQGASAGCFLIISTAQASVGVGGLDSVVNHSCGIRVLFKPTKEEARFLWDSGQIDSLREGHFGPGDAWVSIDDGQHNNPEFVKFPKFGQHFDEYRALDALLQAYYL